ncbi:hypothetical protein [Dokdonella ginsengisoli]|uniref:DUF4394 domain-containing protein n=1 Tax=Dokdonella ginsengisoli TaxID=363846 RepID=A0ABV9QW24_9GAMM
MATKKRVWALAGSGLLYGALAAADPSATRVPAREPAAVAGQADSCDADGICLAVTVSRNLDPQACEGGPSLDAVAGEQVNFCYTVTNHSTTTYEYHTLGDNGAEPDQQFLFGVRQPLAPGESYQYNRILTVGANLRSTATWTAVAALPNYVADDTAPADFVDVTAIGQALDIGQNGQAAVALPFPVNFYGGPSRRIAVGVHGAIGFGTDVSGLIGGVWDQPLPTANAANSGVYPVIAPLWMRLDARYGAIYTATLGSAPNRRFVVEWYDRGMFASEGPADPQGATFEVVFSEGSDDIVFQYLHTTFEDSSYDHGLQASVGMNYGMMPDGVMGIATQYSLNEPRIQDGLAIRWTPSAVVRSVASAWSGVTVGAPVIRLDHDAYDVTLAPGEFATQTLSIGNYGNRPLRYEVGTQSTSAHVPPGLRHAPAAQAPGELQLGTSPSARLTPARIAALQPLQAPLSGARGPSTAGAGGVPGYTGISTIDVATFLGHGGLAGFDLLAPQTLTPAPFALPDETTWSAGDFVGDDLKNLYAITSTGGVLFRMDVDSGTTTMIGATGIGANGGSVTGAAYDAVSGLFYVVSVSEDLLGRSKLYTVDPATGASSLVGGISIPGMQAIAITDIAVDAGGAMYGFEGLSHTLVAIDRATGDANVIGDTGIFTQYAAAMDFDDGDGRLYLVAIDNADTSGLVTKSYVVDPTTGAATALGVLETGGDFDAYRLWSGGLAIARSGRPCANLDQVPWLVADPASGAIGDYGVSNTVDLTFDASTLQAGVYTTTLCVNSNDPLKRHVAVPVTLTVGDGGGRIFANGFDG